MNRIDRLSRNFFSVVRSFFAKTYPKFVIFDRFFETKKKKIKKKFTTLKIFIVY